MPGPRLASSFDNLRSWDGSQSRAFEELAFQLLRDDVPRGSRAVRTGNPDGGIEWYAIAPRGREWGWQAKHVHTVEALLTAMTQSVRRLVQEREHLTRLTFVISVNLPTSTQGRERKSARQKYEDKVQSWKTGIPDASAIDFRLVQESDLLAKLSELEHRGRYWFWFQETSLTPAWFEALQARQADVAGDRYRPDLQVDIPIAQDLAGLGFAQPLVDELVRRRKASLGAATDGKPRRTRHRKLATAYREIGVAVDNVTKALQAMVSIVDLVDQLDEVETATRNCVDAIRKAQSIERDLHYEWQSMTPKQRGRRKEPPTEALGYRIETLGRELSGLRELLTSAPIQALRRPLYFLSGSAGSGKTHLFLDAARVALTEYRPALVLFGSQFRSGTLWASICEQLGLPNLGSDELLGALDSAAEASSLSGRRCVVMIDALNETPDSEFWRVHLPALRSAVSRWKHVALAVSCRDTYLEIVAEDNERSHYLARVHPGFAGRETEAAHKFFAHYGLDTPRVPLIAPEFTLPLFLRLYCEGLSEEGLSAAPGHEGRLKIFSRFLRVKMDRIARSTTPSPTSDYALSRGSEKAKAALSALLDEIGSTGREVLPTVRAEQLVQAALPASENEAIAFLGVLQNEGVFTREHIYTKQGQTIDGVRVAFQAFADFLVLKRRLELSSDVLADEMIRKWLADDSSWGILEAAAVVLPEAYGTELPDFLRLTEPPKNPHRVGEHGSPERSGAIRSTHVFEAFFRMLPYRESQSIGERTIELLNACIGLVSTEEFFDVLFLCAPHPGSRLNGEGLHRYLQRFKMPDRDSFFGFAMYDQISDEANPITRLARWAAVGPHPGTDPEVVRLAVIPLLWVMSSPNRFMRDWVTKALVQLMQGHLGVLPDLIRLFWRVDDPYVVQRVMVVAAGSVLRGGDDDSAGAREVAETVLATLFKRPMTRPDELLLDAGRVIVRWGLARGIAPVESQAMIRRPYRLKAPGNPPKKEKLETKYGYVKDQSDEESYGSVRSSVLGYGDFGRYVIESGLRHFSRYRIEKAYKAREPREPRLLKKKWAVFVASLTNQQRAALREQMETPNRWWLYVGSLSNGEPPRLSAEQHDLLNAAWRNPPPVKSDEYPSERARRWVFMRTLSLGWTPKRFGRADRWLGHGDSGRGSHKSERWGKKYQWMAYHELLARVADNYQASRSHWEYVPYEDLYQILGEREIDPTLPPIAYRSLVEEDAPATPAWGRAPVSFPAWPPIKLEFRSYREQIVRFLADTASEPRFEALADVRDESGRRWVLLDGFFDPTDPEAPKAWLGLQQPTRIDSWFVPARQAKEFTRHVPEEIPGHSHVLLDEHGHADCCYSAEVGHIPSRCYHRHPDLEEVNFNGQTFKFVATTESYLWEGGILDCSLRDSARASMPSAFIHEHASLHWQAAGPSWNDVKGVPVFVYNDQSGPNASYGLLVRADWLKSFLRANHMHLVWTMWWQRRQLVESERIHHPSVHQSMAARLDSGLRLHRDADDVREAWPGRYAR